MKDIVVLGSSGFAQEIVWLLEDNNEIKKEWNILGFIDHVGNERSFENYGVIGDDDWLVHYPHTINVVCGIGKPSLRKKVVNYINSLNNTVNFPNIISQKATVSRFAKLGKGCIVCAGTIITTNVCLGDFVTVNLNCTIGHGTKIGEYTTINPGVNISGSVFIEQACDVGTATSIIQGKRIGANSILGAGSVIIRNVPGNCTVVGNPGMILER